MHIRPSIYLLLGLLIGASHMPLAGQAQTWRAFLFLPPAAADSVSDSWQQQTAPAIWWNGYSGLQVGARHRVIFPKSRNDFRLAAWYHTGLGTISSTNAPALADSFHRVGFDARLNLALPRAGQDARVLRLSSIRRDGLWRQSLSLETKRADKEGNWVRQHQLYLRHLYRGEGADQDFLPVPDLWTAGQGHLQVGHQVQHQGNWGTEGTWQTRMDTRMGLLAAGQAYGYWQPAFQLERPLGPLGLRLRGIGRLSLGQTPPESALYLAGANPESAYEDPFFRARGWVPSDWYANNGGQNISQAHQGGGLGLRGYTGYRAEFFDGTPAWRADQGLGLNAEWSFAPLVPDIWGKLGQAIQADVYLFYDLGVMARNQPGEFLPVLEADRWRQDAGLGLSLRCLSCDRMGLGPIALRFDMPFFVSRPPTGGAVLAFRWVAGFGRSF